MKAAAAEQPDNEIARSDIVQRLRHHRNKNAATLRLHCVCLIGIRWPVCRSQCDSGSTQYKEYESHDQNESKYAAADVHVDLQVVRLSGQWNIKRTQQSVRHRTYQYFDTQGCQLYRCLPLVWYRSAPRARAVGPGPTRAKGCSFRRAQKIRSAVRDTAIVSLGVARDCIGRE
jgi:hypothetical protein